MDEPRTGHAGWDDWSLITIWALCCGLAPVVVIGGEAIVLIAEDLNGLFSALTAGIGIGASVLVPTALATGAACLLYQRGSVFGPLIFILAGLLLGWAVASFLAHGFLFAAAGAIAGIFGVLGAWSADRDAVLL
ncbi:MAG: hypothetical protein AAGJ28_12940 [Pseudomonadota bacterium]